MVSHDRLYNGSSQRYDVVVMHDATEWRETGYDTIDDARRVAHEFCSQSRGYPRVKGAIERVRPETALGEECAHDLGCVWR